MRNNLDQLIELLKNVKVEDWNDINDTLNSITNTISWETTQKESEDEFFPFKKGVAFITFDFGIDGVSIEICKYANAIEQILSDSESRVPLHFIAGDFYDKADIVLAPHWQRFRIPGMNGWAKWNGGKLFSQLYYEPMPEGSEISKETAKAIWNEAVGFSISLGSYLTDNNISLLIPVNIPTNPGNFAIELAIVMVTEALGTYVISSNHDFYWEGGKPASERKPGEPKGPRDHFFTNMDNKSFFTLFKKIYPWNGRRWIQVNINTQQSEALISKFGFPESKVFELGTAISDKFFEDFSFDDVKSARKRMAYILSDGNPVIKPVNIDTHILNLDSWMKAQKPIVCAIRDGITLDPSQNKVIYCLQPTRVIARKRIEKDFEMLTALFGYDDFRNEFLSDKERKLIVHITGPVPIEHKSDLEKVLNAYKKLCASVPREIAERMFIAFSVGTENHPSFKENNLEPLCIETIYRLATVILFPSETEGRGLPIIEASACGIPIICSRYYPEEVFAEVVGENLPEEEQIKYFLFPEDEYSEEFLARITDLMLKPEKFEDLKKHNKEAVRKRYSTQMLKNKFIDFFAKISSL